MLEDSASKISSSTWPRSPWSAMALGGSRARGERYGLVLITVG